MYVTRCDAIISHLPLLRNLIFIFNIVQLFFLKKFTRGFIWLLQRILPRVKYNRVIKNLLFKEKIVLIVLRIEQNCDQHPRGHPYHYNILNQSCSSQRQLNCSPHACTLNRFFLHKIVYNSSSCSPQYS